MCGSLLGRSSRPNRLCGGAGADLLANGVQLLHLRAGHDVDRANFGPLIGHHGVLAQTLDAHIANEHGDAHCHHAHQRIDVHLDHHPGGGTGYAHQGDQYNRLGPMLNGEALVPFESVIECRVISYLPSVIKWSS